MYYGIRNEKVWDVCGDLRNKRTAEDGVLLIPKELEQIQYLNLILEDVFVGDSWDFVNNINLKDSPQRFVIPEKSEIEKKLIELEDRIKKLEEKVKLTATTK